MPDRMMGAMNMISDVEQEGMEAYRVGKPETANPYEPGTREFFEWADGWGTGELTIEDPAWDE